MIERGFTLIEILVVLFIISIVTSVALLSIGRGHKQIESFTNELAQTITLAEEQALLQPAVLGLIVEDQSFRFVQLQASADKKNNWIPLQDSILSAHRIPNDIQVTVKISASSDEETKRDPQVIISTNGDVTPFTIYVGKKGQKPSYAITGDADGNITSKALSG